MKEKIQGVLFVASFPLLFVALIIGKTMEHRTKDLQRVELGVVMKVNPIEGSFMDKNKTQIITDKISLVCEFFPTISIGEKLVGYKGKRGLLKQSVMLIEDSEGETFTVLK
jgi:hypothetical protein